MLPTDEVAFDPGVSLLRKDRAAALKSGVVAGPSPPQPTGSVPAVPPLFSQIELTSGPTPQSPKRTLRLVGSIPPELWNRLGTKILPKLRSGDDLRVGIDFSVSLPADAAAAIEPDLRQILDELGLAGRLRIE